MMELFGIMLSIPVAFVASVVYAAILKRVALPKALTTAMAAVSILVLVGLAAEWVALATVGAVACRAAIGPPFYLAHLAIFLLAIPALVNLLVLKAPDSAWSSWVAVGFFGSMLALPVVITQYGVSEALYGIDGN